MTPMVLRVLIIHCLGSVLHAILLILPIALSGLIAQMDRTAWFFIVQMMLCGAIECMVQHKSQIQGKPKDLLACQVAAISGIAMLVIFWCALIERVIQRSIPSLPLWYQWAIYTGFAVSILGMMLRIGAILTLGDRFQTDIQLSSAEQIHSTGLYRYIAHPGEVGFLLIVIGGTIQLAAPISLVATLTFLVPISIWRMQREDVFLSSLMRQGSRC